MYLGIPCPACGGTDTRIVDVSDSERSHHPRGICDKPGCEFKAPRRHTVDDAIDIFKQFQLRPRWKIWYRDQHGEKQAVEIDEPEGRETLVERRDRVVEYAHNMLELKHENDSTVSTISELLSAEKI